MSKKSEEFTPEKLKKAVSAFRKENGAKIMTASKVKACIQAMGLRMDGEFVEAIADEVYRVLIKCAQHTIDNKRTTIRPFDI
jgi:hypothetical protein